MSRASCVWTIPLACGENLCVIIYKFIRKHSLIASDPSGLQCWDVQTIQQGVIVSVPGFGANLYKQFFEHLLVLYDP